MTQITGEVAEIQRSTFLAVTPYGIAYGRGDTDLLHHPTDFYIFAESPTDPSLHTETTKQLTTAAGGEEISRANGALILAAAISRARECLALTALKQS